MLDYIQYLENIMMGDNSSGSVIYCDDKIYTRFELFEKSAQLAAFFESSGVRQGDKIIIQLNNCIEFVFCYFAGIIGGYTIVPVNPALHEKDIDHIMKVVRPALIIKQIDQLKFNPIRDDIRIKSKKDTIATIFFTSGSTNRPKGVCHKLECMLANAIAFNQLVGIDEKVRMLHVMPMAYMAGFLNTILCPVLAKGSVIISPQFNAITALSFWQKAKKHFANAMWISPSMAMLLARLNRGDEVPKWAELNLSHVFIGTAPLSPHIKHLFDETFHVESLESYGMTEVMLVSSNTHQCPRKMMSVGRLIEGVEIEVRGNDGAALLTNQEGKLYVKSSFSFAGYLADDGEIRNQLVKGWFETGDCGYLNEYNDLFIVGRLKDMIIRGGIKISPRNIEEVLLRHPNVLDAIVLGKQHVFWGEEVVAVLQVKNGDECNEENMLQYCKNNLSADVVPSSIICVDSFPRSSTGKVVIHKLRELL